MQIRVEGPAVTPLQTGFAQNWLERTRELVSGPVYYPATEPAGPHLALTLMSSPVTGASTVRIMYYLSIICARRRIWLANPYFVPDPAGDRHADRCEAARRRRQDHGVRDQQRQLAVASEQRPPVWAPARGGRRDLRVSTHDAAPQNDGRGRRLGDDRHDELR